MALAFADYDRDGWLDVLVTNDAVPNFLFRNNQNGTFTERALIAGIGLNDDGRALSSMGADFRDINNDGSPDIFITALANETFPLFQSLPKGLFEDITYPTRIGASTLSYSGWSTGIYDLDNDGWKDIFTANGDVNDNTETFSSRKSKQQNLILWNTGKNTFRPEAIGGAARHRGAAFADLNNDGAIDIVTSSLGEAPTIWLNNRAKANHWLIIETTLGAEVLIGNQHNQATQAVGYASSSSPQVHFGMGAATSVEKIEVRFPGGKIKTLFNQKTNQRIRVLP
ncbi:MAG: CRTAC1 family protein [Acidobacteria bacterium]|nr:CRTAC1 family protein [Acidobacteriota bacterium]